MVLGHGPDPGLEAGGADDCPVVMVTRFLVGGGHLQAGDVAGRHPALAGTVIGPLLQASQTPVTSVPPEREWTIRRHGTLSGRPSATSWMLVPQEVPVSVTVTCT